MRKTQKILILCMWVVAGMALVCVAGMKLATNWQIANNASKAEAPAPMEVGLPVLYPAPDFTLTDQNNQTFSKSQLIGHPWVADFVFTTCPSLCPMMSTRMSGLQSVLPAEVKLVSFSVDPTHDTPELLLAYSQTYHAQAGRWIFLTGPEAKVAAVVSGMKTFYEPAKGADSPIVHSPYFVLVDGKGMIRRYYDTNIPGQTDEVGRDVKQLLSESSN